MKTLFFCLIIIFSFSLEAKTPKWVNSPNDYCSAFELCAVGEGAGQMMAEANARKAIAKVFETQVKAKTDVTTSAHQKEGSEGVISGSTSEDVFTKVEETTDQTLKGVVIKETYQGKDAVYALASLDKRKAKKNFKGEMESLDEKILGHYKDGRRSSLNKILKLFEIRKKINEKYELLHGSRFLCPVKYKDVAKKKKEKRDQNVVVFVKIKEIAEDSEIQHLIIQQLLENDYRVITDKNKKYKFEVKGELTSEKQYLNVKGFEKYKFLLKLKSFNDKGVKVGALEFAKAYTGRSMIQAYENAAPFIKQYLSENINELNMD